MYVHYISNLFISLLDDKWKPIKEQLYKNIKERTMSSTKSQGLHMHINII